MIIYIVGDLSPKDEFLDDPLPDHYDIICEDVEDDPEESKTPSPRNSNSLKKSLPFFGNSFLTGAKSFKPDKKHPPPNPLTPKELTQKNYLHTKDLLKGHEVRKEGGLKLVDKETLDRGKGVLLHLIKEVATKIFMKGGISRISIPVRIFEPRSSLERMIDLWRFAPTYLEQAAYSNQPLERLQYIITFAISGLYLSCHQLKPFNPLLGETLQGYLDDDTQIFIEHISHHPPIAAFLLTHKLFKMHGHYEFRMKLTPSQMKGQEIGPTWIEFTDNTRILFRYPKILLGSPVSGERTWNHSGSMIFEDKKNKLMAIVIFDSGKQGGLFNRRKKGFYRDQFNGLIFEAPIEAFDPKIQKKSKLLKIRKLGDLPFTKRKLAKVRGRWLRNLSINDKEMWKINEVLPSGITYKKSEDPNLLASDFRFREDLTWLMRANFKSADKWKINLEVQQRADRANREKGVKRHAGAMALRRKDLEGGSRIGVGAKVADYSDIEYREEVEYKEVETPTPGALEERKDEITVSVGKEDHLLLDNQDSGSESEGTI